MTISTTAVAAELTDALRDRIAAAYLNNTSQMTVVLARELNVPETFVLRSMPAGQVTELNADRWEPLIRRFEELGDVHVIVTNGTTTIEAFGRFGNFSAWKDYFNVQTRSLDMHIRAGRIASIFAVEKPGHMDGVPTLSFQFYDTEGSSAFKVFLTFGGTEPEPQIIEQFRAIRRDFAA
jgi:putative heme iron utilization protein